MSIEIPNAQRPQQGTLTGGQPNEQHLQQAQEQGYTLIINTRGLGEPGTDVEPQIVEALGLEYLHIPMSGPGDITLDKARELANALDNASGSVMVHCASGNRVGALFALKAFHLDGKGLEEALKIGRDSGLTRMETMVRAILSAS